MSDSKKPGPAELTELMARVFDSDASEAFGQFMVRQIALTHMAPNADDALLDGVGDRRMEAPRWRRRTCSDCPTTSARS